MTISNIRQRINGFIHGLFSPFFDGGEWSWKKAMTGSITVVFCYACVGYLHKHDYAALPEEYMWVIAGVFIAYFGKDIPQGIVDVFTKYFESKISSLPKTQ